MKAMQQITLVNWDGRPAIFLRNPFVYGAYAVLEFEGAWVEVDAGDVVNTGDIIKTEEQFKAHYQSQFGRLKILNI